MNLQLARILVRLYSREWRARYEEEFISFLQESSGGPLAILNVVRAGLSENITRRVRRRSEGLRGIFILKPAIAANLGRSLALIVAFTVVAKATPLLALCRPTDRFIPFPGDPRIHYEPGAEKLAAEIAVQLPKAVERVRRARASAFTHPISIYICATSQRAHTFGQMGENNFSIFDHRLYIAPDFAKMPTQRLRQTLIDELSLLAVEQRSGFSVRTKSSR